MGSKFRGDYLGTAGLMSCFSLYYGHHLSTIEGGLINTDDKEIYNILLALRSHGWDRDLSTEDAKELSDEWDVSPENKAYTFYYPGFNLRATDLQAFLGLRQIDKLDGFGVVRKNNFDLYKMPELPNCDLLHEFGFYVPNHQDLTIEEINKICKIINDYGDIL